MRLLWLIYGYVGRRDWLRVGEALLCKAIQICMCCTFGVGSSLWSSDCVRCILVLFYV